MGLRPRQGNLRLAFSKKASHKTKYTQHQKKRGNLLLLNLLKIKLVEFKKYILHVKLTVYYTFSLHFLNSTYFIFNHFESIKLSFCCWVYSYLA